MALGVHKGKPVTNTPDHAGCVRAENCYDTPILQPLDPIVPFAWITCIELEAGFFDQIGDEPVFGFTDEYHRLPSRCQDVHLGNGKNDAGIAGHAS